MLSKLHIDIVSINTVWGRTINSTDSILSQPLWDTKLFIYIPEVL